MGKYQNLVIMGQDIAEYGGAFKITDSFVAQFGKKELEIHQFVSAVVSGANGLSINGIKSCNG